MAEKLSERLEAHALAWPTVYKSDRDNAALLREAARVVKAVEDAPEIIVFNNEGVIEMQGSSHLGDELIQRIKDKRVKLVEVSDGSG